MKAVVLSPVCYECEDVSAVGVSSVPVVSSGFSRMFSRWKTFISPTGNEEKLY